LTVDERTVARAEVFDLNALSDRAYHRVSPRHLRVVDLDVSV
jgi:hypothetical protein